MKTAELLYAVDLIYTVNVSNCPQEKRMQNENGRVASPESVSLHLEMSHCLSQASTTKWHVYLLRLIRVSIVHLKSYRKNSKNWDT